MYGLFWQTSNLSLSSLFCRPRWIVSFKDFHCSFIVIVFRPRLIFNNVIAGLIEGLVSSLVWSEMLSMY